MENQIIKETIPIPEKGPANCPNHGNDDIETPITTSANAGVEHPEPMNEGGSNLTTCSKKEVSLKLPIWTGILEWYGLEEHNDGQSSTHHGQKSLVSVPCTFYTNVQQEDGQPEVPIDEKWNNNLAMHLIPKSQLKELDFACLQNTKNVSVSIGNCPDRMKLTRFLRTGRYVGCIHIPGEDSIRLHNDVDRNLTIDMKVIVLLYSRGKQATVGFIPNDHIEFIRKLLQVIPDHSTTHVPNVIKTEDVPSTVEKCDPSLRTEEVEVYSNKSETHEPMDEEATTTISPSYWDYKINSDFKPIFPLAKTKPEPKLSGGKKTANFYKGCKWAPDGSCLLTNSDDDILRIYNVPENIYGITDWDNYDVDQKGPCEISSVLNIQEGGQIYDYCWYPTMSSYDPVSCCLLTTTSDAPIHLWDAFTGSLRASYLAYNQVDQVIAAKSVAFDPTGEYIYCGFDASIRTFNITRPGRECTVRKLKHPQMSELSQPGIASCIAVNPSLRSVLAVGSYLKTVGLYHDDGSVLCILQGHLGGVTHLRFSNDGTKLFTGGRKDSRIICWDMRFMGDEYKIYDRVISTNQRIYFDITPNDKYLITGGTDGVVKIWDVNCESCTNPILFNANTDCVNGVSINPFMPVLATSSGQRHLPNFIDSSDSSDSSSEDDETQTKAHPSIRNSTSLKKIGEMDIKLWKFC